jgi:hypothetical protein
VIGEMQRHIDIKHEAGCEPDLAKAGHCGSICAIAAKSSSAGSPWFNPRRELRFIDTAGPPTGISPWRAAGDSALP